MVSYPSFDPNLLSGGRITSAEFSKLADDENFPFFNRAISAMYPPASTIKMVVAAAALAEGVINENTIIIDKGYISTGGSTFKNWKAGGHGPVNLLRALQVSNDTYFYIVGGGLPSGSIKGLGIEKLSAWAKKFGFGSKTGIDIAGETAGFVPNGIGRDWYLGDTYITAIGQGDFLVTPLQINTVITYFANGGFLFSPRVVKEVEGQGATDIDVLASGLVSPHNYELVRQGLKAAVEPGGTAYPLFGFAVNGKKIGLAGKTGTAEVGDGDTHAGFTVFGPYDDPTISLTVFLEKGGGGADAAAPIAAELLKFWFSKSP